MLCKHDKACRAQVYTHCEYTNERRTLNAHTKETNNEYKRAQDLKVFLEARPRRPRGGGG